jgi:hypothetical protein
MSLLQYNPGIRWTRGMRVATVIATIMLAFITYFELVATGHSIATWTKPSSAVIAAIGIIMLLGRMVIPLLANWRNP